MTVAVTTVTAPRNAGICSGTAKDCFTAPVLPLINVSVAAIGVTASVLLHRIADTGYPVDVRSLYGPDCPHGGACMGRAPVSTGSRRVRVPCAVCRVPCAVRRVPCADHCPRRPIPLSLRVLRLLEFASSPYVVGGSEEGFEPATRTASVRNHRWRPQALCPRTRIELRTQHRASNPASSFEPRIELRTQHRASNPESTFEPSIKLRPQHRASNPKSTFEPSIELRPQHRASRHNQTSSHTASGVTDQSISPLSTAGRPTTHGLKPAVRLAGSQLESGGRAGILPSPSQHDCARAYRLSCY